MAGAGKKLRVVPVQIDRGFLQPPAHFIRGELCTVLQLLTPVIHLFVVPGSTIRG
jgi:hypothetical protein